MNELTQRGIAELKAGNRATARQMLGEAVRQDPSNVLGWLWLSGAVDSDDERVAILRHVLRLDPSNQTAQRGLNQILNRRERLSKENLEPAVAEMSKPEQVITGEEQSRASVPTAEDHAGEIRQPTEQPPSAALYTPTAENSPAVEPSPLPAQTTQERRVPRRPRKQISDGYEHTVFRTRPSVVLTLVVFWIFFFGAVAIGVLLFSVPDMAPEMAFAAALVTGLVFELVVVFVAIRQLRTRYIMTNQNLSLPFRGQRVQVPTEDIFGAETRQSPVQKILSTGDIWIDAVVAGELAHIRLRDVPECQKRTEQILSLVKAHQG